MSPPLREDNSRAPAVFTGVFLLLLLLLLLLGLLLLGLGLGLGDKGP